MKEEQVYNTNIFIKKTIRYHLNVLALNILSAFNVIRSDEDIQRYIELLFKNDKSLKYREGTRGKWKRLDMTDMRVTFK